MVKCAIPQRRLLDRARPVHLTILVWAVAISLGGAGMFVYATTPGTDAAAVRQWPVASRLAPESSRPTLIVFAHPRCPCTAATMQDLAAIMSRFGTRVSARVVFLDPGDGGPDWTTNSENWRAASGIPGVEIVRDSHGIEAENFGAKTSGRTLLFNGSGQLVFQGGITAARGEAGDNAGSEAIVAILQNLTPKTTRTASDGCPLFAFDGKAGEIVGPTDLFQTPAWAKPLVAAALRGGMGN